MKALWKSGRARDPFCAKIAVFTRDERLIRSVPGLV
jgi:hypothetical protein